MAGNKAKNLESELPSREEILQMINSLGDEVSEEDKEQLRREILGSSTENLVGTTAAASSFNLLWVLLLFAIVAAIIGTIAYKLIMKEKNRTRKKQTSDAKKTKTKKSKTSKDNGRLKERTTGKKVKL